MINSVLLLFSYRTIEKSPFLSKLLRKGGIRFKLSMVISVTLFAIIILFVLIFTTISADALMAANDKLCQTIAGNISSAESILTAERSPLKRSLILQDMVSGLAGKKINGLEHVIVYDLLGKLVERKETFAAHTDLTLRAQPIPAYVLHEIKQISSFHKERIIAKNRQNVSVPFLRYRIPTTFFRVQVGVIEISFTEESILGSIRDAKLTILLFSSVLLLMGILVAIVVATGMVRPIQQLSYGMVKVREGDLELKMDTLRHDELGVLSTEFNTMIVHLREKLQMQKFVSEETISMIHAKTPSGEIKLGGTRVNCAFLFSDIRGFTSMSEKIEPEQVVQILNEYLDLQSQIIKRHHGDIDKFVGDEVMAVFKDEEKADQAMECAIEIMQSIQDLNQKKAAVGQQLVQVGIGLNLGDVVQGRIGSKDRMDNTSIGDPVNLAARLCSQAGPGMILASRNLVAKSNQENFRIEKREPIKVKGKEKLIEIYAVLGKK